MADQGYGFSNLLNNPVAFDWNTAPNVGFKGIDFQSLLKPPAAAPPSAWNRTPQSVLEYQDTLRRQGHTEAQIESATAKAAPPPTPEQQGMDKFYGALERSMDQQIYNQSPAGMREQLEMGKEMAKEQAKQTLKFQTLANIPGQIERSFAADKYYQGMSQIPEIYRGTFASVPSMNIQAPSYNAAQVRYFS